MRYADKCGGNGQATEDNIIVRMRFVCRIIKVTNTKSEYAMATMIIRNSSMLRYRYIVCVVRTVPVHGIIKLP
jgi:hypothetical protein